MGSEFEMLFTNWKQMGEEVFPSIPITSPPAAPVLDATFITHVLNRSYAIFGSLEETKHRV